MPTDASLKSNWKAFSDSLGEVVNVGKEGYSKYAPAFIQEPIQTAIDKYGRIKNLTGEADRIAEQQFPDSARDSSVKNAFRHSLGTGMLTQELGGNLISAELAKRAGYLWEGLGLEENLKNPKYRQDTYHDLNANALGAKTATEVGTRQELVAALSNLARNAKVEEPPSFWRSSPGYMTRTVQ